MSETALRGIKKQTLKVGVFTLSQSFYLKIICKASEITLTIVQPLMMGGGMLINIINATLSIQK